MHLRLKDLSFSLMAISRGNELPPAAHGVLSISNIDVSSATDLMGVTFEGNGPPKQEDLDEMIMDNNNEWACNIPHGSAVVIPPTSDQLYITFDKTIVTGACEQSYGDSDFPEGYDKCAVEQPDGFQLLLPSPGETRDVTFVWGQEFDGKWYILKQCVRVKA